MKPTGLTNDEADIRRYEQYLAFDPDNCLLLISLADLYNQAGKIDEATTCYEKCLDIESDNRVALGRLASLWIAQKRYSDAESTLQKLLCYDADSAVLRFNLGIVQFKMARWHSALENFRLALDCGLDEPNCHAYIVRCLHHADELNDALNASDVWLNKAPGPETEGYIALLEMDMGLLNEAYTRAKRVISQDPKNTDATAVAGNYHLATLNIEAAVDCFSNILSANPNNPRGWLGFALTRLYQHDFDQAIHALGEVIRLSPNHYESLVTLGWLSCIREDRKASQRFFLDAIESNDSSTDAHCGLAFLYFSQNNTESAMQEIDFAINLDSNPFSTAFAKSLKQILVGNQHQGVASLEQVLQYSPHPDMPTLLEHIQTVLTQKPPRNESHPL